MTNPSLSPAAFGRRYGINASKVGQLIKAGELKAVNVALKRSGRPRWRITPEALADFERSRSAVPAAPAPRPTRRRKAAAVIEFF